MNRTVLLMSAIMLSPMINSHAIADIGTTQRVADVPAELNPIMKFEGVWVGPSNVTMIKELKGYVLLQGMDDQSAWSAKCVVDGNRLTCRGSGASKVAKGESKGGEDFAEFAFESTITYAEARLRDHWKATFPAGKELEGTDFLRNIEIRKFYQKAQ